MGLNYISLQKAIVALENGINIYYTKKEQDTEVDEMEIIQSGIIQNFEVCYEISWKLMKKKLEENIGRTEVDGVSRKELFRIAAQNKLIDDIEKWFVFHDVIPSSLSTALDIVTVLTGSSSGSGGIRLSL